MQKGRGLPEITKLGDTPPATLYLNTGKSEAWEDVSTLLFTCIREHLPIKERIRKQREIRNVRTICGQTGVGVGRVNEWIIKKQRRVGSWEKWISWHQRMSQAMNKQVGHTALIKRWNQIKRAMRDGMKQRGWQEHGIYPKINQSLNWDKTGVWSLPNGSGCWQIGVWWVTMWFCHHPIGWCPEWSGVITCMDMDPRI